MSVETRLSVDDGTLALDACGLLNLAAAVPLFEAATALEVRLICVREVAAESLYLEDEVDGQIEHSLVDMQGVEVVDLTDEEIAEYVALAVMLDDGEAATLAAAGRRGWPVMTDDRKAIRIAQARTPAVEIVSTGCVLRKLSNHLNMTSAQIRAMLARVAARASFVPRSGDSVAAWWEEHR